MDDVRAGEYVGQAARYHRPRVYRAPEPGLFRKNTMVRSKFHDPVGLSEEINAPCCVPVRRIASRDVVVTIHQVRPQPPTA